MATRGLELSEEKTVVTHIDEGFDFLGWTFRKFKGKLIIKPSKKSIKAIVSKLSETINVRGKAWNQDVLIMKLNEQIRGWTNYHQSVSASEAFAHLDYVLFELLWHWAKRRHPKKGKWWISTKYWHRKEKRNIIKVVDSEVFDSEENSLALSKEAFASYILEEDDNFKHVSVDGFESIFNIISDIINGVYE